MPLLLETIKIEDGTVYNLPYHQKRCNESRKALFSSKNILTLADYIDPPIKGLYRCRIVYDRNIHSVKYIPYEAKNIESLRIIPAAIDYSHKFADREALNDLLKKRQNCDEIIIEKAGFLTDTTISNIAFYDGEEWFTPEKPLLEGTMRAKLLASNFLKTGKIRKSDLKHYTHVALINAMIGFKVLNTDPAQIR